MNHITVCIIVQYTVYIYCTRRRSSQGWSSNHDSADFRLSSSRGGAVGRPVDEFKQRKRILTPYNICFIIHKETVSQDSVRICIIAR